MIRSPVRKGGEVHPLCRITGSGRCASTSSTWGAPPGGVLIPGTSLVSSVVERLLGKKEAVSSTLTPGSRTPSSGWRPHIDPVFVLRPVPSPRSKSAASQYGDDRFRHRRVLRKEAGREQFEHHVNQFEQPEMPTQLATTTPSQFNHSEIHGGSVACPTEWFAPGASTSAKTTMTFRVSI